MAAVLQGRFPSHCLSSLDDSFPHYIDCNCPALQLLTCTCFFLWGSTRSPLPCLPFRPFPALPLVLGPDVSLPQGAGAGLGGGFGIPGCKNRSSATSSSKKSPPKSRSLPSVSSPLEALAGVPSCVHQAATFAENFASCLWPWTTTLYILETSCIGGSLNHDSATLECTELPVHDVWRSRVTIFPGTCKDIQNQCANREKAVGLPA